jgi:hypothetical protein
MYKKQLSKVSCIQKFSETSLNNFLLVVKRFFTLFFTILVQFLPLTPFNQIRSTSNDDSDSTKQKKKCKIV